MQLPIPKIYWFIIVMCYSDLTYGQEEKPVQYWSLELSVGYLAENTNGVFFHEPNMDFYASYEFLPGFHVGPRFRTVLFLDGYPSSEWQRFFLAGSQLRWDILTLDHSSHSRFFVDFGFFRGNYCTCDDQAYYYRRDGLWYLALGAGFQSYPFDSYPDLGVTAGFLLYGVSYEQFRFSYYNFPYLGIVTRLAQ